MTYVKSGVGGQYLHSADGGTTWDTPFTLGYSGITPFIAYTGCVLHVIVPDSGHINYIRNPTGNTGAHCTPSTGIPPLPMGEAAVKVYPNPFTSQTIIEISFSEKPENTILKVFDFFGSEIINSVFGKNNKVILSRDKLNSGIYFYKVFRNETIIKTGKMIVE